jgi:hypothetical protein
MVLLMTKRIEKDAEVWRLRIEMTTQLIWQAIKKMGENSTCKELKAVVAIQWFGGFSPLKNRMLPNGSIVKGGPLVADIAMRDDIVSEVLDGLKQRPRPGKDIPCARFILQLYEFDMLLALAQMYLTGTELVKVDIDPYKASAYETTVYTLLHVSGNDEDIKEATLVKPLDEQDLDACTV